MSINLLKAVQIANKELIDLRHEIGEDLKIIEDATIEKNYYWVFFYNSKIFLETGNFSHALAGNSPFIVDKIQGNIYKTGTAYDIEFYMKKFEEDELPAVITKL